MTFNPTALHAHLPQDNSVRRYWVALSGGLDSVVLLHALAQLKLTAPVAALHINHQISPNAFAWQQHCAEVCAQLQVPFSCEAVQVERAGRGLEDAARTARYDIFEKYLMAGDCLLMAHHANDQAETLLLRLMRGAGPGGLAAMSRSRGLGEGKLLRPLLDFTRAELQAYAATHTLRWVDDESNADTHYDRNYLRQNVMPTLHNRWPDFPRRWQQTAQACADTEQLLEELAAGDLSQTQPKTERLGWSVSLTALQALSLTRRQNLLRYWFRQHHFATPERVHLQHIDTQIINGREDAEADVRWGDAIVRRYRDRVHLLPLEFIQLLTQKRPDSINATLAGASCSLVVAPGVMMQFDYCATVSGSSYLRADLTEVQICWRMGGERCQPKGRAHSQTLKKLLQEYGVEPWWREHVPLVYVGDILAAVGDLWVCEGFSAQPGDPGYQLRWCFS
jgi:tRNA(Ile)-lysidine synthase